MTARRRIAAALYGALALASVLFGLLYLTRDEFMPYHADALGKPWADLQRNEQVLILALMRVAGGGWMAVAAMILFALPTLWRGGDTRSRLLLPVAIVAFYAPTLFATLSVTWLTPATAPWYGNAAALVVAALGLLLDPPWRTARA